MANYLSKTTLEVLAKASKEIIEIRNRVAKLTSIDLLDTDKISSLLLYEVVSQYDKNYNINFSRNGEDAKSNEILIENKTTRVQGPLTKTGKHRKGAGTDAAFQFHADGDLDHQRYILAAKDKDSLSIVRLYDISSKKNRKIILDHLLSERLAWHKRCEIDSEHRKRDLILLPETLLIEKLTIAKKFIINNCTIFKD